MNFSCHPFENIGQQRPVQAAAAETPDPEVNKLQTTASRLEFILYEIEIPEAERNLIEEHGDDIASLTASLSQLLTPKKNNNVATLSTSLLSDRQQADAKVIPIPPHYQSSGWSQPSQPVFRGAYQPYHMPIQARVFASRNVHHINYPVIPRWRDRAHLRRIQQRLSSVLPKDLPPWSVRAEVPIVPQPDWSEEGRYLLYDGFSVNLFREYSRALENGRVPLIAIPYRDADMKRVLVEKGVVTNVEAEGLVVAGPEHWRGPMEYMEDEKHKNEIKRIEEGGRE